MKQNQSRRKNGGWGWETVLQAYDSSYEMYFQYESLKGISQFQRNNNNMWKAYTSLNFKNELSEIALCNKANWIQVYSLGYMPSVMWLLHSMTSYWKQAYFR